MSQLTCNHRYPYLYQLPGWGGWACNHPDCDRPRPEPDPEDYKDILREQRERELERAHFDSHFGR